MPDLSFPDSSPDAFAAAIIERIELVALAGGVDTMSLGGEISSRLATWFAK